MARSETCLITGASGFIGRYLVRYLHEREYKIIGIGRKPKPPEEISKAITKWISCDFSDPLSAETSVIQAGEVDYLFHLSATVKDTKKINDFYSIYQPDIIVPIRIIDGLAKYLKHICFLSSTAVYGKPDVAVDESSPVDFEGLYGANKAVIEDSLSFLSRQRSIPLSILRISSVYGPGMPSTNAIPTIISCLRRNEQPKIFSDPQARRDYIYVKDLAPVAETVIKSGVSAVYNIASGFPVGLLDVVGILNEILEKTIEPKIENNIFEKNQDIIITKARKELHFRSTHPRVGFQKMIEYGI